MSTLQALILGIIQGITEFLPVSSSGHLELGQYFFGLTQLDQFILFNLVCHLGTLLALVLIFLPQIQTALTSDKRIFWQVCLGTLPLFPLVLILKPIKSLFDQPQYLGFCFLLTALLLYLGLRLGASVSASTPAAVPTRRWRDVIVIGLFQAVAILPGVSRSGATISAGRMLGWSQQDAITFSFLLAIPAILGGMTLELLQLVRAESITPDIGWSQYLVGFVTAFGVGYVTLKWLMRLANQNKFIYFAWYCLLLGIITTLYFNS